MKFSLFLTYIERLLFNYSIIIERLILYNENYEGKLKKVIHKNLNTIKYLIILFQEISILIYYKKIDDFLKLIDGINLNNYILTDITNNINRSTIDSSFNPYLIDDIINREFDDLWNELWDINNIRNKNHYKEYTISKQKFYELRLDSNSSSIIKNTKPLYNFNEWGFPKGRRELYESDLICAMRELEEETFLKENDYIVLDNCKKIKEYLTGTNGINYLHNYFIALTTTLPPTTTLINDSNREIGDIRYCDYNECVELVRPYHLNKLKIIYVVYSLINDYLQQA
jgi:ADP-ribose pyrophosphatase YjhB (NUDIX family)